VAAVVAAAAGWAVVRAVAGGTGPGVGGSVVQGLAGGPAVLAAYLAVAFALDRRDVRAFSRRRSRGET
jgi:putative peptidoglycan lipid II flippase